MGNFSSSLLSRRLPVGLSSEKENRKEMETGSCLVSVLLESALSSQLVGRLFNLLGTEVRACYVLERDEVDNNVNGGRFPGLETIK